MINLTITGENGADFFAQLAEVAARLTAPAFDIQPKTIAQPHDPVMPEVAQMQTEKPKRVRRTAEQIAVDNAKAAEPEAGEQDAGESVSAGLAEPEQTERSGGVPVTSVTTAKESPSDAPLDFDKDVAPVVLGYVRSKGKPWVVAILGEFGVEKASSLPAGQWPELIAALHDAAAE